MFEYPSKRQNLITVKPFGKEQKILYSNFSLLWC